MIHGNPSMLLPPENPQADYARALGRLCDIESAHGTSWEKMAAQSLRDAVNLLRALLVERRDLLGSKPWEETAADAALREFAGGSR